MKRVAIIHPWYPRYREAFFSGLRSAAKREGIDVSIFCGETPPEWRGRGDTARGNGVVILPTRILKTPMGTLLWKNVNALGDIASWDLVIVEQAVRNVETYSLLFRHARLASWGHGKTYTKRVSGIQERVKLWLTRRTKWFFSYTESGAVFVRDNNFPGDRITVLNNTVDTSTLKAAVVEAAASDRGDERLECLFLGGMDTDKRLPFLLRAVDVVHAEIPDFRMTFAGSGDEAGLVKKFCDDRGWCVYLGRVELHQKARLLARASAILMPGRVGLVAVDSFAAGIPIVTTRWPFHAPEFDYLQDRINAVLSDDNVEAYAAAVVALLLDPPRLAKLRRACVDSSDRYTTEAMVDNFMSGLRRALLVAESSD